MALSSLGVFWDAQKLGKVLDPFPSHLPSANPALNVCFSVSCVQGQDPSLDGFKLPKRRKASFYLEE